MQKFGLILTVFLLVGCGVEDFKNTTSPALESSVEAPETQQTLGLGDQQFYIEVATTSAQREKGLMYRESMPANAGMLFVFDGEAPRNFWMKNTLIPLDMIWLNEAKEVVDIQAAEPCKVLQCPVYSGKAPAKYVLELNQGVLRAQIGILAEF